jgi:hypothetical protein
MPSTGDKLSILGFGCMRLPTRGVGIDEKRAMKQVRGAIDLGVNYIDTAWPYHGGKSETFLGKALADGYRDKIFLADKLPPWMVKKRGDMDRILDEQLKKMRTDHIDYYLAHALNAAVWERMKGLGIIEFLEHAKVQGKIRHIGYSFHGSNEDFMQIVDDYAWEFCQIQYNILDENNQAGRAGLEHAAQKGMGVIIMEPLRGGSLTLKLPKQVERVYDTAPVKRSPAEWGLRWVWNHPQVTVVLSGMNDEKHIDENLRIAGQAEPDSLTRKELAVIEKAVAQYRSLCRVGCTGCQYCMPCPSGVNIPMAFDFYNQYHMGNGKFSSRFLYWGQLGGVAGGNAALASQCVNCGKCAKHCPQKIDIPGEMKNVEKTFEGKHLGPMQKKLLGFVLGLMTPKSRD